MIEESTSPALAEDMKALNEIDDAAPSAGFSAGWRAALRNKKQRQHYVLRYALPAAAVICYLLGGTALYRSFKDIPVRSASPMLMSVPAPATTAMPSTAEGQAAVYNEKAAFEAPDLDGSSFDDLGFDFSFNEQELHADAEEANVPEDAYASYSPAAAEISSENSFFGSMKDFVLMSWPWAAGVLLLIAVIMAVVNSRRKTG